LGNETNLTNTKDKIPGLCDYLWTNTDLQHVDNITRSLFRWQESAQASTAIYCRGARYI